MNEYIELNLNEMPYPPPESVLQAARDSLGYLNRYTELSAIQRIRKLLGEYAGVAGEQIVIGPGSDLLLREIVLCFAANRKVVMASPTFLPAARPATHFADQLVTIRLRQPEFSLAKESLLEELTEPSLVPIDNPNNPTGKLLLDRDSVENILDMPDTLLVVDETYFEFSGLTFAEMVGEHANLALARTLDKAFGLAGARIGYLIAGQTFLDVFSTSSAFLPQASLQAATEALLHPGYMWKNVQRIIHERERLGREMEILGAFVFKSSANFLLVRCKPPGLAEELRDRGDLVLNVSDQLGPGFIRVAAGTPEDNNAIIRAYRSIAEMNGRESTYDNSDR